MVILQYFPGVYAIFIGIKGEIISITDTFRKIVPICFNFNVGTLENRS
jgi:hypothetical protein